MKIDKAQMLQVAETVIRFNEYARGDSAERIAVWMEMLAYMRLRDKNSYLATYGFVLTSYDHCDGGRGIHASVSASLFRARVQTDPLWG